MSHAKSILIVEDDGDFREAIAAFLAGEGYSVVEAEHGQDALQHLRTSALFCLILLDLFMPVMNGWAFRAEQLRDPTLAGIPVVVISADADAVGEAAALGAVASMVKPLDFGRLLTTIARYF
jgi:CheY-like chemotaxis protein